jgi:hypothetical protein
VTDGSLTPQQAFEEAAAILVNQYTALAGSTIVDAAPALGQSNDDEKNELNTPIEELNLTARTANALINLESAHSKTKIKQSSHIPNNLDYKLPASKLAADKRLRTSQVLSSKNSHCLSI